MKPYQKNNKIENSNNNNEDELNVNHYPSHEYSKYEHVHHEDKKYGNKVNKEEYKQYTYLDYHEIEDEIHMLSKKYPNLVKIETAQKKYGLGTPGGYCDRKLDKKKNKINNMKCHHFIVILTNHKINSKNKPQVFLILI
jgi:hypothetical protein